MTLKDELIAAIKDEENHFGMERYTISKNEYMNAATCDTASCMAGWIEALRPYAARKLRSAYVNSDDEIDHCGLAARIWQDEMNEPCTLDFLAHGLHFHGLVSITREQAIAHIKGDSDKWPLLDTNESYNL